MAQKLVSLSDEMSDSRMVPTCTNLIASLHNMFNIYKPMLVHMLDDLLVIHLDELLDHQSDYPSGTSMDQQVAQNSVPPLDDKLAVHLDFFPECQ